jgi:hypothetical protein
MERILLDNMKQLDIIVMALESLGGRASYAEIYSKIEELSHTTLTYGQKAGIRKNIETHSSDSQVYSGKEDLFYSVCGIGNGVWGLRK